VSQIILKVRYPIPNVILEPFLLVLDMEHLFLLVVDIMHQVVNQLAVDIQHQEVDLVVAPLEEVLL